MNHVLLIPHDEAKPVKVIDVRTINEAMGAVSGPLERLCLGPRAEELFVNEHAIKLHIPVNRRATVLMWLWWPASRPAAHVCGDALLTGGVDKIGMPLPLDPDKIDLITKHDTYCAEFETVEAPSIYTANRRHWPDYFTAAAHAVKTARDWTLVTDARVMPCAA